MKTNGYALRNCFAGFVQPLLLAAVFAVLPSAQAGVLEILRGDDETAAPPAWQRVAFVGPAEVLETTGKVERLTGIEKWEPLQAPARLLPGDVIRSHTEGGVLLQMRASGSLVRVTPGILLRLTRLQPGWEKAALTGREAETGFLVRGVRGQAYIMNGKSNWQPVEVATVLPVSALVRTAPGTSLDLLDSQTGRFVRIKGSTQVRLDGAVTASRRHQDPALAVHEPSTR